MPFGGIGRRQPHCGLVHIVIGTGSVLRDGSDRHRTQVGSLLARPPLPLSEWELWACANQVITAQGSNAPTYVAEQLGALAFAGDTEGVLTWQKIAARISQLSAGEMAPGSRH